MLRHQSKWFFTTGIRKLTESWNKCQNVADFTESISFIKKKYIYINQSSQIFCNLFKFDLFAVILKTIKFKKVPRI